MIVIRMTDSEVSVNGLKDKVKRFCDARDWDKFHPPKDLAIGIITEAGELLAPFRFKSDEEAKEMLKNPKKREAIGEEVADVLYFLLRFAQMNGFDLSDELNKKLEKNEVKYPIDRFKGSNKKYNELG